MQKRRKLIPSIPSYISCLLWNMLNHSWYFSSHIECLYHYFCTFLILAWPNLQRVSPDCFPLTSYDHSRPIISDTPHAPHTPQGVEGSSSRLPHEVQYWSHSSAQWLMNHGRDTRGSRMPLESLTHTCWGEALRSGQGLDMERSMIGESGWKYYNKY